ncbi:MFS transporter [Dubosiella newyorkensis]|uniref:MFS transporter n=1 Tax=Dubosiella newyorkensis TaxID=1862672 RepID=UPI00272B5F5F|nr:MFS transporter [Dubosiella newyorkensis]
MNDKTLSKAFLWRQRIGYGAADFACNLIWQMISLYLLYYYTDIANLNGLAIASMFVVCRIIDGITDLLIGYAIDKTHTRWGKSRPYFLWGAIPLESGIYAGFLNFFASLRKQLEEGIPGFSTDNTKAQKVPFCDI